MRPCLDCREDVLARLARRRNAREFRRLIRARVTPEAALLLALLPQPSRGHPRHRHCR